MVKLVGSHELVDKIKDAAVKMYIHQGQNGIIIADTKFEFGLDENGNLALMDEVLAPGQFQKTVRDSGLHISMKLGIGKKEAMTGKLWTNISCQMESIKRCPIQ
ncbi:hypothetical protein BDB00DRAFT_787785 [Zychaea mexicana]|uniref:uncharacterized protein n=1 Tax=Zychaea mexicana TaxID=64656 RepID=UPI0022FF196A|nr:uncharacterized protein BDB00DRAFT_787785 [Zychaea mexicana]KAI9493680.1 hypothetical protein BDB00DRAFT_787785 [Zychaea mexicana]